MTLRPPPLWLALRVLLWAYALGAGRWTLVTLLALWTFGDMLFVLLIRRRRHRNG